MGQGIVNLNQGTPTSASQIPYYDPSAGQDRRASLSDIAAAIVGEESGSSFMTQYAAPGATGFSVTVAPGTTGESVFLLLSQGGAYAAGTIVLPTATDGQEVLVHSRQAVTALTVTPASGDSLSGAPTTLAAASFFRLRYDLINKLWCRVG